MKMRWVLTWKELPEEEQNVEGEVLRKAKARLVVIGYTDPDLTEIPRDSPTLAVRTRFMMYAIAAASKWKLYKGDIETAFLQGPKDEVSRRVYGKPPPELLKRLGLSDDYIV